MRTKLNLQVRTKSGEEDQHIQSSDTPEQYRKRKHMPIFPIPPEADLSLETKEQNTLHSSITVFSMIQQSKG